MVEPVIQIRRDGNKVVVTVNSKLTTETPFYPFERDQGSVNHAELLRKQLESVVSEEMKAIREKAYLAGYKDGRAKRIKQTWFSYLFHRDQ